MSIIATGDNSGAYPVPAISGDTRHVNQATTAAGSIEIPVRTTVRMKVTGAAVNVQISTNSTAGSEYWPMANGEKEYFSTLLQPAFIHYEASAGGTIHLILGG